MRNSHAILLTNVLFVLLVLLAAATQWGQYKGLALHRSALRTLATAVLFIREGCFPAEPVGCQISGRPWYLQSVGKPWSLTQQPDGSLRFELRPGDAWPVDDRADHAVERTELMDSARLPFGRDVWISFDFMLEPGAPLTSHWLNISQIRASGDPRDQEGRPIWTQTILGDGRFRVYVRWTKEDPQRTPPQQRTVFRDDHFERGHRYSFLYRVRIDPGGHGLMQGWRDGKMIVNYAGPLGYPDQVGPYVKFGFYRGATDATATIIGHYYDVRVRMSPDPDQ